VSGHAAGQGAWSVTIFAARESAEELLRTIDAACLALRERPVHLEVMVNGSESLARSLVTLLQQRGGGSAQVRVQVWFAQLGDKSNTWNIALHQVWDNEELAFFIDGYVTLLPGALDVMGREVLADTQALGGTATPSGGRSEEAARQLMLKGGGIQGNLCCLKSSAVHEMRQRGIRLPRGLYRGDGLMGAFLAIGLDPHADWKNERIHLVDRPSWLVPRRPLLSLASWRAVWNRRIRQARGRFENLAIKDWLRVRRLPPEHLPADIERLMISWAQAHDEEFQRELRRDWFARRAWRDVLAHPIGSRAMEPARLLWSSAPR
jgi:hypothetical protein